MGKIYVGQTALRIQCTCGVDITGSTTHVIKYIKPDEAETQGEWIATISDAANGVMFFDFTLTSELDVAGIWKLWAYIVFSDGKNAPGEPFDIQVFEQGDK